MNRLKAYRASLVLFPRRKTAPKKGDADPEALSKAEQATGPLFPIAKVDSELEFVTLTEEQKVIPRRKNTLNYLSPATSEICVQLLLLFPFQVQTCGHKIVGVAAVAGVFHRRMRVVFGLSEGVGGAGY